MSPTAASRGYCGECLSSRSLYSAACDKRRHTGRHRWSCHLARRLEREIRRCIAEDGTIKDNASPELENYARKFARLQSRIRERLQSIVREAAGRNVLQESLVTLRDGRYVIPVKQEHRHAVAGVLHDQSASGATLFIEPAAIVEMNNELSRIQSEEKREIERILRKLTEEIRSHQHSLATLLKFALDSIWLLPKRTLPWHGIACAPKSTATDG